MDGVLVNKNVNNNKRRKKHNNCNFEIEQDENFSFIAGYTSGGFSYGNPWEETEDEQNDEVSLTILSKICKTLNADFGDIVEYVPDTEIYI